MAGWTAAPASTGGTGLVKHGYVVQATCLSYYMCVCMFLCCFVFFSAVSTCQAAVFVQALTMGGASESQPLVPAVAAVASPDRTAVERLVAMASK